MKAARPGASVASLAAQAGPGLRVVLLFGPDSGLAHERATAWVTHVAEDPRDAFRVAELTAGQLKDDPARLADEAAALSMIGGRRVVWIRDLTDSVGGAVLAEFMGNPVGDALVVAEAGDLPSRSTLRKAAEASPTALAIACYHDNARDIAGVIQEGLAAHGLAVAPDAVEYLVERLGGDRLITRSEIDKLGLYMSGAGRVERADAMRAVGDSAVLSVEDVIQAALQGDVPALSRSLHRALQEGESPVGIVRMALRQFQRLHLAALLAEAGRPIADAIGQLRPPPFPRERERMAVLLQRWRAADLAAACTRLLETEQQCKSTGIPADCALDRSLIQIATLPRRARAGR